MPNVDLSKVPVYYHKYISLVQEENLGDAFEAHTSTLTNELTAIDVDKWNYRYAEGKWSIKEVVQHIIDAERIFCYRALRFARKDATPLPGFDENTYTENANADRRTKEDLIEELKMVQQSSKQLFASFTDEQLSQSGKANENSVTVKGIGFIIVGHSLHHKNVLMERYLK